MPYESFDHTADIGIRVWGPTLEKVFEDAARALFSEMFFDLEKVQPQKEIEIELTAEGDLADLLVDWLNELIYRFEVEGIVFADFEVHLEDGRLRAKARGEPFDPQKHRGKHHIKSVTWHELSLEKTGTGWEARFIVDV